MTKEVEFTAADGTQRKAHYGAGKQPWDYIVEFGWAPYFAAGNVLKYVRRAAFKNGPDDLEKARWYYRELIRIYIDTAHTDIDQHGMIHVALSRLAHELTYYEKELLKPHPEFHI